MDKRMDDTNDLVPYGENYSESSFQEKILRVAKKAGAKVVYVAFLLFFLLQDERVSSKDKMIILGALGYFILPTDLVMDFIPIAGYTDDLVALLLAVKAVYGAITPGMQAKAKAHTRALFGEISDETFFL